MKKGIIILLGLSMAALAGCHAPNRDPEVKAYLNKHGLAGESQAKKNARRVSHSAQKQSKQVTVDDLEL